MYTNTKRMRSWDKLFVVEGTSNSLNVQNLKLCTRHPQWLAVSTAYGFSFCMYCTLGCIDSNVSFSGPVRMCITYSAMEANMDR